MDPLDPTGPCVHCKKAGMTALECGGKAFPGQRKGIAKPTRWEKSTARFILENGGEESKELLAELHRKREAGEDILAITEIGVNMRDISHESVPPIIASVLTIGPPSRLPMLIPISIGPSTASISCLDTPTSTQMRTVQKMRMLSNSISRTPTSHSIS